MVRLIVLSSAAVMGLVLGVVFYVLDGIPQSHDEYGRVDVSLKQGDSKPATLELPEGEVRLNWEGGVESFGSSRTASEVPDGMEVTVTPAAGGESLDLEGRGGYDSMVGDTGWVSWKSVEVPEAGAYKVAVTQPSATVGFVTAGKAFWKPADNRLLGALLIGFIPIAIALVVTTLIGIRSRS